MRGGVGRHLSMPNNEHAKQARLLFILCIIQYVLMYLHLSKMYVMLSIVNVLQVALLHCLCSILFYYVFYIKFSRSNMFYDKLSYVIVKLQVVFVLARFFLAQTLNLTGGSLRV